MAVLFTAKDDRIGRFSRDGGKPAALRATAGHAFHDPLLIRYVLICPVLAQAYTHTHTMSRDNGTGHEIENKCMSGEGLDGGDRRGEWKDCKAWLYKGRAGG
jgi:hypothetical protein